MIKRALLFICILVLNDSLRAQIVDDSTKVVYGPHTTAFAIESNYKFNQGALMEVDSSLLDFHNYHPVTRSNNMFQDLGLLGSAMTKVFLEAPRGIGRVSGFTAYQPYFQDPQEIKYYDTKSPFTKIGTVLGRNGRQITEVEFSRSDSSNFNIGLDFRKYSIDKQGAGRNSKRQIVSTQYDIYSRYGTSESKYLALFSFSRVAHVVLETGGIDTTGVGDFFSDDVGPLLAGANVRTLNRNLHLFHHYRLNKGFQVYQQLDFGSEKLFFDEENMTDDSEHLGRFFVSQTETADSAIFRHGVIESGIKGGEDRLFYSAYAKLRNFNFGNKYDGADSLYFDDTVVDVAKPKLKGTETYLGGTIRFGLGENRFLLGQGEISNEGMARIKGEISAPKFEISFDQTVSHPSMAMSYQRGNHRFWMNNFEKTKITEVTGRFSPKEMITVGGKYMILADFIFVDQDTLPRQSGSIVSILSPEINFDIPLFGDFHLSADLIYTNVSGGGAKFIHVPDLFVNASLYYHGLLFSDNLDMKIGLIGHLKSSYFANGYDPVSQQFFLQDSFDVEAFPLVEAFASLRFGRASFFVKYNNLWEIISGEGFFAAPNYLGRAPGMDLGFHWMFFD